MKYVITKEKHEASLVAQTVKRLPTMRKTQVDPLEKEVATLSSSLAWKIPWRRNLVGYSPWGHKESDSTGWLHFTFKGKHAVKVGKQGHTKLVGKLKEKKY